MTVGMDRKCRGAMSDEYLMNNEQCFFIVQMHRSTSLSAVCVYALSIVAPVVRR